MDVLGCTWMCVQADSFLFLPYLIVALCRWWLRSGRAVSGLTVDHPVVVLFLSSTFLPLLSCCRVVCVRWWMRVTCASHRVGDGFSRVLFISFPFSVCLVARLFPSLVTIHELHGDLTRETNGEAQERNRGATKRRKWNKEEESYCWEESHMVRPKWHDLLRPSKFQLPSLGSLCCVLC